MLINRSRCRTARVAAILTYAVACVGIVVPVCARGQTDFANTDAGRPLRVQDAIVLERFAFELHLPTFRVRRGANAPYALALEPELAVGILSRTQLDFGGSLASSRRRSSQQGTPSAAALSDVGSYAARRLRVDAVHVRLIHQLNVETLQLPAIAIGGALDAPLVPGEHALVWSALAAATRTWGGTRTHLNVLLSSNPDGGAAVETVPPWELGVAADRTLPLRHILFGAELGAMPQGGRGTPIAWRSGAGVRWQWTMRSAVDAGIARTINGDRAWSASLGMSTAFGIRSFSRGYR